MSEMEMLTCDRDLVLCVKPFGVLSEGEGEGTMPALLRARLGGEIYPVHRLDRETGGCMVYARTKAAAGKLSALAAERRMEKEYLTVVRGRPTEESGTLRDLLFRDAAKNKTFVVQRLRRGVREAELSYRVEESVETEAGTFSLLSVRLQTGRTHQIRVQFASRGMPVVGDKRYGSREKPPHLALWSRRLAFPHPFRAGEAAAQALPPAEWPWTLFRLPEAPGEGR
ncbi:MAG: RluA family pseudouridine synthase [Oscillospiraceae bacterium]